MTDDNTGYTGGKEASNDTRDHFANSSRAFLGRKYESVNTLLS